MANERVVVAMSGGVDSSVAAALLVEQGYDVVGIMLRLWSESDNATGPANRCCALDAQYDAERVAESLGIPFYLLNVSREFKKSVVDYFVTEYAIGRTPNPCVECNRQVRFDLLLRRALALDAVFLATGHYARIKRRNGCFQVWRGVDPAKDQSYVLHVLGQDQLAHILFPLGEFTKTQVREMAHERGLLIADRRDSQDLCFVNDGDYRRFLSEQLADTVQPGPIRDTAGRVLGEHRGLSHYTVGQRKGLNISGPKRLYVLDLDVGENALVVGTVDELGRDVCIAHQVTWIAGEPPGESFDATAKIRYKACDAAVAVTMLDASAALIEFRQPQRDITPGQAIVLYQKEVMLGGGTISFPPETGSGNRSRNKKRKRGDS